MNSNCNIVVAGASGYIGKALIPKLLEKFGDAQVTALSRAKQKSEDPRVTWKECDLFSASSLESAIPKSVDLAIYLVHSMGPTAQLDQGSFSDYDLLLADNFARVLQKAKVTQMIYLGGLVPDGLELSRHLRSRLEVEEVFSQYRIPTTVFRAGLILGAEGSSFQMLLKLVRRLPVMICPHWTQTLTTPVDLSTVLTSLTNSALEDEHIGRVYDLSGCQPLTYIQMMQETARRLGLKRIFISVPFFTPTLSRLWVRLITNTPKDLVYPLVESLEHPMVARESHAFVLGSSRRTYFELLESAFLVPQRRQKFFHFRVRRKTVRSVQRLPLPKGKDAVWVKNQYLSWLPKYLSRIFISKSEGDTVAFCLRFLNVRMLVLQLNREISDVDFQHFQIVDGLLVSGDKSGRLEFRVALNRKCALAAIHDYKPSLPWYVYIFTQAQVHLFVMQRFAKHLGSLHSES